MATQLTDPNDSKQLQQALYEAHGVAFELLKCAIENIKPSAALLADYGLLQQGAEAAMLAMLDARGS